ncbi:MAG: ribonuclease HII [Chloroflexi bacterium]|nr:ribonuclease HII [Chloroflexota bacterium]
MKNKTPMPTLDEERALYADGYQFIAGVDEAGRGSIFGPVCVGMVVLPSQNLDDLVQELNEVRDSKKISRPKVYRLSEKIKEVAVSWGVGAASAQEVDKIRITAAVSEAGYRAYADLQNHTPLKIDYLLTDSRMNLSKLALPAKAIVKGDMLCLSIACAAILAKTQHDILVRQLAEQYDEVYQLQTNVGYGTAAHIYAVRKYGHTDHHRKTFILKARQLPLPE